ncbi:AraC family transcriptional regulator [Pseudomaricurvus alkylphenolicus]|uniref:AraC family transcriptional regulator n=1 Tax=Pseudomaricurvus alkylphenolicus TaxID=1306991 RepID=UPI001420216C|nr:AraC family transcriptional regulator [Pseudomaricurvus alkylphenolicus]NIB40079.1 AraC family transcriptional regulator [Pseudomaricurvus alkylphenolicus]
MELNFDQRITIPSHYARVFRQVLADAGHDFEQVCREAKLPLQVVVATDGVLEPAQYVGLVKRCWHLMDDEFLGMGAERCKPGLFALMVRYVLHFDTLRALLKEYQRFYRSTRDDVRMEYEITDSEVRWYCDLVDARNDPDHFLIEFLLVASHRLFCWITGTRIHPTQCFFAYSKPSHYQHYRDLFNCEHHFDQQRCGFAFDLKHLSSPLVRSSEEMKVLLESAPAQLMVMSGTDNSYTTRIKGMALKQQKEGRGFPDFVTVASELCVSPQTLRRKLQAENTSYQAIKDLLRRDIAVDKLINEDLPVADIGQLVGFVEPASFTRAFKQWTGVSPAQYRARSDT